MKKQLFAIFGPIFLAIGLLIGLFSLPIEKMQDSTTWNKAASSMSDNILKGLTVKNKAIASGEYVPFFGSSELSRISPFHPSVLAKKYGRDYTPFLLGAPGTQSLAQAMSIQSMSKELTNKKAVFIVSPQWFVKDGVKKDYFNAHFSKLQCLDWLANLEQVTAADQYFAQRLLNYDKVKTDKLLANVLASIQLGERPSQDAQVSIKAERKLLQREDALFSTINLISKNEKINRQLSILPETFDYQALNSLADEIGKERTSNNSFQIDNSYYTHHLKGKIEHMKGSQNELDYCYSPEFSDFQLVLEKLAKTRSEVLFILPPVNKRWSDYTGLSQEMLREWSQKITYQLESQGFDQIADLTQDAAVPYFMQDTIHLGWSGWLAVDQKVAPFLAASSEPKGYQLNDYFYSTDWQQKAPKEINQSESQ